MKLGNSTRIRVPSIVVACSLALVAADIQAQSGNTLEEVVVTATRRTSDLQTTGITASVLSGQEIVDKGVYDLYDLQYAAPSMTISGYGSANEFSIRGVGRTQVDIDVPSGVVIYRDGAPTIAGYFQTEPYFDLESIEVLRGPQGTYVGKNAAGGAVFINTNDPSFEKFSANLEGGIGNNDLWELSGIVNIPVSDTFAVRASYKHTGANDYYDSITGDFTGNPGERNLNSFRGAAKWEPTDQFSALVKIDYHDLDFGGNVVSAPGFPLYDVEQNGDIDYQDESFRVVGDLKYTFANGIAVKSLTAYQKLETVNNLDLNGSLPLFYSFTSNGDFDIVSQEINILSPEDQRFRWIVGGLYFEQNTDIPYYDPTDHSGFGFRGNVFGLGIDVRDFAWLATPWQELQRDLSVFGHVAYDITENLEIEGGLRYTNYFTTQFTEFTFGLGDTPPVLPFAPPNTSKIHEGSVDGQVALNWTINEQHFGYALFSRGHVPSGINIFPPFRIYDEMDVKNYEVGWKANWLDDRVRTQTNFYFLDINDQHVNFESPDVVIGQDNRNAPGNTEIWGIEFSLQAHLNNWHIDAGMGYMDSDIGKFENAVDPFRTAANGGVDVLVDLSGERTPYTPEFTGNVGVSYDFFLGGMFEGYMLTPRIDVSHTSDLKTKLWDSPLVKLDDRTLANGRITLAAPNDRWSATFWANNMFDKEYISGIQNLATLIYAGRPLEFGFNLKYNF